MFDRSETHFMKEAGSERESEHLRDVFRSGFFDQGLDNSAAGAVVRCLRRGGKAVNFGAVIGVLLQAA